MAGYEVLWANEFIASARDTYLANWPDVPMDARDIREVKAEDILEAIGKERGDVDVMEGSPPCASFSTAGKRHETWGHVRPYSEVTQRTDDLFMEFGRLVTGVQPRVFVAENVSGLVKGVAKGYFKEILAMLKQCGYRVEARLLDAQWLGVPQMRQRIIFVGVRNDLGLAPAFPTPLSYRYTVRDALPWIVEVKRGSNAGRVRRYGQEGMFKTSDQPSSAVVASGARLGATGYLSGATYVTEDPKIVFRSGFNKHKKLSVDRPSPTLMAEGIAGSCERQAFLEGAAPEPESDISRFAIGEEWDKLRIGQASVKYFNLTRPNPDRPCPTVTQTGGNSGAASVTHPTQRRKFTIAELRRICAFPDDFVLTGTYQQQWERLGRAVPPIMMRSIAEAVRDGILGKR